MTLGGVLYRWLLRERLLNGGATNAEAASRLPGDELLHPEPGETIGVGTNPMRFERVEPEHVLALRSANGNWVWTFVLQERDGRTRLISRNRFRLPSLASRIAIAPMIPGSLIMERKTLRGIKARAERLAAERSANASASQ